MKRLFFISYRRANRPQVTALADDIKKLGFDVWFDESIPGGQEWWEVILSQIRDCDVFLIALSPEYLDSTPCKLERHYAQAVNKPILPVLVSGDVVMSHLEREIGNIHAIDYRRRDAVAALELSKAINNLPPADPLPDPLPVPPEAPGKYLSTLRERISQRDLNYRDQVELLADLRIALQTSDEPEKEVFPLLERLKARKDIAVQISEDIERILDSTAQPAQVASAFSVSKSINVGAGQNPTPQETRGGTNWVQWAIGIGILIFILYACDSLTTYPMW